jgi:hypothetical protein
MDFDQTWYILKTLRESGTLLIFKVKGQGHGLIFRRGDTPRFALPLFSLIWYSGFNSFFGPDELTLCLGHTLDLQRLAA